MSSETGRLIEEEEEISGSFEREWHLDFHGTFYNIIVSAKAKVLTVDVEAADSDDCWSNDFSAEYIEEITHKAGNFKRFNVFVKMLASALSKENDSVFADVLSYSDLEMLKARKLGSVSNASQQSSRSHLKRYIILTYANEFDRVHFPLPLSYQDDSNIESLKRIVQRLRKKSMTAKAPSDNESDKIRESRQIITQLRQENTELRHRLRQAESRILKSSPPQGGMAEIANANAKLRKQVDSLKKDLSNVTIAYERYRIECSRELAKLKAKSAANGETLSKFQDVGRSESEKNKDDVIRNLRRRILELERNQFFERQHRSKSTSSFRSTSPTALSRSRAVSSDPKLRSGSPSFLEKSRLRPIQSQQSFLSRPRSASPSSSLGKRFNPTAYQQHRESKRGGDSRSQTILLKQQGNSLKSENLESGYSSQSSTGSRISRSSLGRKQASSDRQFSSDESDVAVAFQKRMTRKKNTSSTVKKSTSTLKQKTGGIAENQEIGFPRMMHGISVLGPADEEENRSQNIQVKPSVEVTSASRETPTRDQSRKSIEESLRKLSRSIDRSDSLRASRESLNEQLCAKKPSELSDIDKRIQALQSFLDSARSGIMSSHS